MVRAGFASSWLIEGCREGADVPGVATALEAADATGAEDAAGAVARKDAGAGVEV